MKIAKIMEAVAEPTPEWAIGWLDDNSGGQIPFIPWWNVVRLLNERVGFGNWEMGVRGQPWIAPAMRGSKNAGYDETDLAHVVVEITIHGEDGSRTFSNVGSDDQPTGQRGVPEERAMASGVRRAYATMGGGLDLYDKNTRPVASGGQSGGGQSSGGQSSGDRKFPTAPPSKRVEVPTDGAEIESALKRELSSAKWPSDVKKVIEDYIASGSDFSELALDVVAAEIVYRLTRTMSDGGIGAMVDCIKCVNSLGHKLGDRDSKEMRDVGLVTAYNEAKARVQASGR